jgi:MFS family permease
MGDRAAQHGEADKADNADQAGRADETDETATAAKAGEGDQADRADGARKADQGSDEPAARPRCGGRRRRVKPDLGGRRRRVKPDLGGLWSLRTLFLIAGAGGSAFIPFFALLLRDRGLTPQSIGLVFAVTAAVGASTAPLWSHLADTRLGAARVLVVSSAATALFALALAVSGSAFWAILLVAVLMSMCSSPGAPLSDALAVAYLGEERISEYGRIRLWASLGWGVAVVGFGALYQVVGLAPVLPLYAAGTIAFGLWTLRLPPGAPAPVRSESRFGALGDVFRESPGLASFVVGMVIVSVGGYAALAFVSLRIVGTGGGRSSSAWPPALPR